MTFKKLLCLLLVLLTAHISQAETLESLITAGKLEARVVLKTPAPLLQKAPIVIAVEVGTAHRFKRSTQIRDFAVANTLLRPISKFAFSETRRRGGNSWAFQSWRFQLHAQRSGTLRTPLVTTFISIETDMYGVVEGELKLPIPPLEVVAPPGTEGLESWIAATKLVGEEKWEGTLQSYQVGDAITRIRRISIYDAPAMAIPESPQLKVPGLQSYYAPALLEDKMLRGSLTGVREERVVFTLKSGGSLTIPRHSIHWFNLKTKSVEKIDFPARTLEVAGEALPDTTEAPQTQSRSKTTWIWGLALLSLIPLFLLLRWLGRSSWHQPLFDRLKMWQERRRTKAVFMQAATKQDSLRCLALLYRRMSEYGEWQLSAACTNDPKLSAASTALMAHAFGGAKPPQTSELRCLWKACSKPKVEHDNKTGLQLNPKSSR